MSNKIVFIILSMFFCSTIFAENPPPPASPPPPPPVNTTTIDCNYHIPLEHKAIEESILNAWAQKAALQTFLWNPDTIDLQLKQLEACFTATGWKSFQDAMKESGNLDTIRTHKFVVTSRLAGPISIKPTEANQWTVIVPLDVLYQNKEQKLMQTLNIEMHIGRKPSGDLGIFQIIAKTRETSS